MPSLGNSSLLVSSNNNSVYIDLLQIVSCTTASDCNTNKVITPTPMTLSLDISPEKTIPEKEAHSPLQVTPSPPKTTTVRQKRQQKQEEEIPESPIQLSVGLANRRKKTKKQN